MFLNHFKSTNISFFLCVVTAIPLHLEIPNIKESFFCPEREVAVRKTKTVTEMKFLMVFDYQEVLKGFVQIPSNLLKISPTDVSDWVPKTAAEIEEERAIKEICYKSGKYEISHSFLSSSAAKIVNVGVFFPPGVRLGEYYRIQYPHQQQSTKPASSPRENELLPLEATEQDLQKGKYFSSSWTMFTTFKTTVTGRNYYTDCPASTLFQFSDNKRQPITKSITVPQ